MDNTQPKITPNNVGITRDIFIYSSVTDTCTYSIISTLDHEDMKRNYDFKSCHRNVKTLYHISVTTLRDLGIKNVIKRLTEWAFDGIVFKGASNENDAKYICKFIKALDQLPPPYDFQWKKCLIIPDDMSTTDLRYIMNQFTRSNLTMISPLTQIKHLTDAGISPSCIILDVNTTLLEDKNGLDLVKFNKLGGIVTYSKDACLLAFNNLNHSLNVQNNHLDYPTSNLVRQIEQDNQKQLDEIIENYTSSRSEKFGDDEFLSVSVDIDFI